MKNIIFAFLFVIPFFLNAQTPIDKLFDKYLGKEGFTSIYITKYMFSLFANAELENKEFDELINNLNSVKILVIDNSIKLTTISFYKEMMKELPKNKYKKLMAIKEKKQNVKFLVREKRGKVSELLLIAAGEETNAMVSIQGNINLKNISKLSKLMRIDELDHLNKIRNK